MNIVICDDEKSTCDMLTFSVKQYEEKHNVKINLQIFYRGDSLIEYLFSNEKIDILFLDIELPGNNGIEIGKCIRERLKNEQMFLIYISSHEQYAMELFQNRPLDFLVKPIEKQRIWEKLDYIFNMTEKSQVFFEYKNKGSLLRIPYKNILYFQSNGRKIEIIMTYGREHFYGKLDNVEKKIPRDFFIRIHKSYIINDLYVARYDYERIVMTNHDVLSISKKYRVMVRHQILEKEEFL